MTAEVQFAADIHFNHENSNKEALSKQEYLPFRILTRRRVSGGRILPNPVTVTGSREVSDNTKSIGSSTPSRTTLSDYPNGCAYVNQHILNCHDRQF